MARTSNSTRQTIMRLQVSPETLEYMKFLKRCVVVHAVGSSSKAELERLLRTSEVNRPGFEWVARPHNDGMYLVESPDREWYDRVVADGRIQLGTRSLAVESWRDVCSGTLPLDVWIRVRGLPIGFWTRPVLDMLVNDFTDIEEIDPKTLDRQEKRWARLRVSLADMELLPEKLKVEINSQIYEVFFEAE